MSTDKTPERLYCVAIEEWVKGKVIDTHLVYIHADDTRHACRIYRQSQPNAIRYHVVTAGKVIAYKIQDPQGIILSV